MMSDTEAYQYILDAGIPLCESISVVINAPADAVPKLLGCLIKEMAETIEPGGINNTKLVKYLTGSIGAIAGLILAGRIDSTEKDSFSE